MPNINALSHKTKLNTDSDINNHYMHTKVLLLEIH